MTAFILILHLTIGSPLASGKACHERRKLSVTGIAGTKEQINVTSCPLATLYSLFGMDTCKLQQQGSTRSEKYTITQKHCYSQLLCNYSGTNKSDQFKLLFGPAGSLFNKT